MAGAIRWVEVAAGATVRAVIAAPFGPVAIEAGDNAVVSIDFPEPDGVVSAPSTALLQDVAAQLQDFFADPACPLLFPLLARGTVYQRRVWQALAEIPPGEVETYAQMARRLDSAPRAIGGACRANAYPIIIPCHRVVSASGLGGYCGKGEGRSLAIKRWLLDHEGVGRT